MTGNILFFQIIIFNFFFIFLLFSWNSHKEKEWRKKY
jgi:hypothetical protein